MPLFAGRGVGSPANNMVQYPPSHPSRVRELKL